MKRAVFFVAALLVGGVAYADTVVGNLGRLTVTNGAQGKLLVSAPLVSSIDKIGAGTYSLSAEQVRARSELGVNVHQGTLAFSDAGGEVSGVTEPPAVMDAAVLWLEASTNVAADADGYVTKWYDVRETQNAGAWGATRYRGIAAVANIAGATNPVMRANAAGQPMVYFNGRQSGSYMKFQKPNGTNVEDIGGIYHVFQVLCISNSLGYALGNRSSADGIAYFHPQNTDGTLGCYLDPGGTVDPSVSGGRAYLDGVYTDMTATSATPGMHLTEYQMTGARAAKVGHFFCDRSMGGGTYKRSGGDYIGEVVLFTNRLDEADRIAVGEYLLGKWVSRASRAPLSVKIASGAAAQVSAEAGVTTAPVHAMGAGTFAKDGAGTVSLVGPAYGTGDAAAVRVDAGVVRTDLAEVDVAARAGDAYAKSGVNGNERTISRTAAAADTFSVSGGVWRVSDVPGGVKKLTATADELVLASGGMRQAGFNVAPGAIEATIPNHSFEQGSVSTVNPGSTTTVEGWTIRAYTKAQVGNTGYDGYVYLQTLPRESDWKVKHPYGAPDGSKVFMGKAGFAAWCTVNVPTGGIYELSFKYCKRGDTNPAAVDFAIVTGTQTNWIGRHYATSLSDFREQRYRTPWLAAGDHVLYFGHVNGTDGLPHYDDFHLRLVPEENVGTAPVPNGNFEMATYTGTRLSSTLPITNAWSKSNTLDGWTLTQTAAATTQPSVAPSSRFTPGYFREARAVGDGQLVFSFAGGVATSPAFKLPAGTWRLRCQGTRWCVNNFNFWAWNGTMKVSGTPNLSATVTVNGAGEPVSLGTVSVSSRLPHTYNFGTPITVTAEDELVLSLSQTVNGAAVVLDDLEFERVTERDELVANGGFASDLSGWTTGTLKNDADGYLKKCNLFRKGITDNHYSHNTCDGNQGVMMVQATWLEQDIAFPSSGVYRLSFWTATRWDYADSNGRLVYGGNALETYLVKDGVTNVIGRTDACLSTNFQHRVYTFAVPAAGTYTFGLRSLNGWPTPEGGHILTQPTGYGVTFNASDCHVFLDAISIVPAGDLPPPDVDRDVEVSLDPATRLRLDYEGMVEVGRLSLGGKSVVGVIDATHPSGLVYGPGALYIRPRGTMLLFR